MAYILIVDDDNAIQETLSAILVDEGHEVRQAANGQEALELVREEPPAVILLDLMMPIMDGETFLSRLSAMPKERSNIPIIILSAGQSAREVADRWGVADYLSKPFDIDVLLNCVDQYQRVG